MSRFCAECGARLEPNSKFCPECGKPVEIDEKEQKQAEQRNVQQAQVNTINAMPSINPSVVVSTPVVQTTTTVQKPQWKVSDKGLVFKSTAPLPSKTGWARWAYIISGLLCFAGGIGVLCFIVVFIAHHLSLTHQRDKLRVMKFKFVEGKVTSDEIFEQIQPILYQKYGNRMVFDREGESLSVEYDSIIYDINLNGDGTFSLWWRKSVAGAIFSFNEYKLYRKIRTGMPLIGCVIQKQFGVI